jgi:hypothetical protein
VGSSSIAEFVQKQTALCGLRLFETRLTSLGYSCILDAAAKTSTIRDLCISAREPSLKVAESIRDLLCTGQLDVFQLVVGRHPAGFLSSIFGDVSKTSLERFEFRLERISTNEGRIECFIEATRHLFNSNSLRWLRLHGARMEHLEECSISSSIDTLEITVDLESESLDQLVDLVQSFSSLRSLRIRGLFDPKAI